MLLVIPHPLSRQVNSSLHISSISRCTRFTHQQPELSTSETDSIETKENENTHWTLDSQHPVDVQSGGGVTRCHDHTSRRRLYCVAGSDQRQGQETVTHRHRRLFISEFYTANSFNQENLCIENKIYRRNSKLSYEVRILLYFKETSQEISDMYITVAATAAG